MKKFCSTCGNQLELSQRFCGECGAVNPFFVPAFTLLSDQSQSLEKLRIEKERIERELIEKENTQQEFKRQELLRKQIEELDREKTERLEKEISNREKIEREKIEASIKKEILQVKEEAEQYKKETIHLVQEVRQEVKKEILEIGEENKRLKHEVEILSKQIPEKVEPVVIATPAIAAEETADQPETIAIEPEKKKSTSSPLIGLLVLVILIGIFLVYFYFTNISNQQTASNDEPVKAELSSTITPASPTNQRIVDTVLEGDVLTEKKDTITVEPTKVSNAVLTSSTKTSEVRKTAAIQPAPEKPKPKPSITEAKVMVDLNGKKISGCGVIIGSDAELKNVSNLVLVETTSSYNKYKCTLKITQGSDTYTAVPYLYYTDDGAIIKVDGTNCE